jgi:hypothetical protein
MVNKITGNHIPHAPVITKSTLTSCKYTVTILITFTSHSHHVHITFASHSHHIRITFASLSRHILVQGTPMVMSFDIRDDALLLPRWEILTNEEVRPD